MMKFNVIVALLCFIFVSQVVDCKLQKGSVKSKDSSDNWIPIGRFWFGASSQFSQLPTWFEWSTSGASALNTTEILIYDDQPNSWPLVYKNRNSYSCQQKYDLAKDLKDLLPVAGGTFYFNESYPRHWYVAIADCNTSIDLSYSIHFHNTGGKHYAEFSLEQQGLWALTLTFFLFFMFLMFAQLVIAFMLHRASSYHRVVKILTLSIILQWLALMFELANYDQYWRNGVGSPGAQFVGQMSNYAAHWFFIIMLLLIARGSSETFALSRGRNSLIVVGAFLVLDVIFWIWKAVSANNFLAPPFMYGSAPGIILLIIRALLGVYFILLLRFSYIEEGNPERRQFLFRFGIIGAVWFFFMPFIVAMVAAVLASSVDSWAMTSSVDSFWYTVNFIIICCFTFFFYWPSRITNFYDFSKADVMIGTSSITSPYETL